MSNKWEEGLSLLQEAIDTIRARGSLRDGETDLIDDAARISGRTADDVIDVMLAIKHVRFMRACDRDSAVDFIAYKARGFAEHLTKKCESIGHEESEIDILRAIGRVPFDDEELPLRAGTAIGGKP